MDTVDFVSLTKLVLYHILVICQVVTAKCFFCGGIARWHWNARREESEPEPIQSKRPAKNGLADPVGRPLFAGPLRVTRKALR